MDQNIITKLQSKLVGKNGIVNVLFDNNEIIFLLKPNTNINIPKNIFKYKTKIKFSDEIEEKNFSLEDVKKIPKNQLMKLINTAKQYVKKNKVVIDVFKKYNVDINQFDNIPIFFKDLDVSARTEHGIIWLNYALLSDGDFFKDYSYIVHESVHWLQQTTGKHPTNNYDKESYLYNPVEQEGFKNQIKYIKSIFGDEVAKEYTDDLLDHHDINDTNERKKLKNKLT